jgi:N-acetylglutamate synthase-like GNAT family acetyltransferase
MAIQIRLAALSDIPALQELIHESVRVLSAAYYSAREIESALVYIFGVDSQLIKDGTYFVAENDKQIVGCGGWSKRATLFGGDQSKLDEPEPLLEPGKDPARIRAFYVHPKWARRGIGRQIITACENAVRDAGFNTVELVATLPGEPLYSTMGYARNERIELTTPEGESLPAFRMSKDIAAV